MDRRAASVCVYRCGMFSPKRRASSVNNPSKAHKQSTGGGLGGWFMRRRYSRAALFINGLD